MTSMCSTLSMNAGNLVRSRQKSYSSWRGRSMVKVVDATESLDSVCAVASRMAVASTSFVLEAGASSFDGRETCSVIPDLPPNGLVASLRLLCGSRSRHLAVLLGQHACGRDLGRRHLQFVLHAGHNIGIPVDHGPEADCGHFSGIHLIRIRADLRIHQISPL